MAHFRTAMIVPIIIGLTDIVIAVIVANISITIITIIVFRKLFRYFLLSLTVPIPLHVLLVVLFFYL